MEILRKLRWVLYPSVFILVFLVASYCSFPTPVLRTMAETSLTYAAMGMGPSNRGLPKVSIKDVSLWRVSGIDLKGVQIVWPGTKKDLPMSIDIDRLQGRLGIMALMMGTNTVISKAQLYGGQLTTDIRTNKQKSLTRLALNASKIDLSKVDFIQSALGAPLQGLLKMDVDIHANSQLSKDGTGSLSLVLEKSVFGPGNLLLPAGGMVPSMAVPQVNLGTFTANFALDKGQLDSKTFNFAGGDLEADMQLSVTLGRIPLMSRLNGKGWFSLKKEFINSNETIKMLFDLLPELRAAKTGSGKVGISLGGTLGRPRPELETYTGEAAIEKKPAGQE